MPGYDISFLIIAAHARDMYKHKPVDFIVHFMQEIDSSDGQLGTQYLGNYLGT